MNPYTPVPEAAPVKKPGILPLLKETNPPTARADPATICGP